MPTMADFIRDYHSDDREDVLRRMQAGEDLGQSDYQPQQQQQQAQAAPEQSPARQWDRTAFRDEWMGSGVRNVPDMQNWLKNTGWGSLVKSGGSRGDRMFMPGGENIDAVMGAGVGGNMAGPQWTQTGYSGGYVPQTSFGASPSPGMMNNMFSGGGFGGGMPQSGGGFMNQIGKPSGQSFTSNRMYNRPQQMRQRTNPSTGQKFQSRGFMQQQPQQQQFGAY